MAHRTRFVMAATAATVVTVVLLASGTALYGAGNPGSQRVDNSLIIATQKIREGQSLGSTTATLGQVVDARGRVVAGGGLSVSRKVRLVAEGLAPTFFTTLTVNRRQMREVVEHLARGTRVAGGVLLHGGALQVATPAP